MTALLAELIEPLVALWRAYRKALARSSWGRRGGDRGDHTLKDLR